MMENREFYDGGRTYMARWNGKKSESGGLWIHKGSHDFDVFNWLLNFPKPKKVSAFAGMNVFTPQNFPFEVKDGIVSNVQFLGGCNGNLKGIGALVEGMRVDEVISRLEGTTCGMKSTSCPDQLAQALKKAIE